MEVEGRWSCYNLAISIADRWSHNWWQQEGQGVVDISPKPLPEKEPHLQPSLAAYTQGMEGEESKINCMLFIREEKGTSGTIYQ